MKNNVYIGNWRNFIETFKNYGNIWVQLEVLVNDRLSHSIIETSLIVPYDAEGFVVFDLVSYSNNIFVYEYSTTAK